MNPQQNMYEHSDVLNELNRSVPLRDKLRYVHGVVRQRYPTIDRIAVAIYDPKTDLLKTFVHSSGGDEPLAHYEAPLAEAKALQEVLAQGRPRVVNDLAIFATAQREHTRRIREQGYASSYTLPMYLNGTFAGFVFFNSYQRDCFTPDALHYMDLFGHLVSLVVMNEVSSIHTLLAAVKTARDMTHQRDFETGTHLDRMSRYARLIARAIADKYDFDDEYIEHVFLFAPLHDIGKIGIPDRILLKPGKLTAAEFELMKKHADKGRQIIDDMLDNFGLGSFEHVDILRNIAHYHHEALDGSGYPTGLTGNAIPMEARIVAVSDIFDALTSRRPYKDAWSNDAAFATLRRLAGTMLDPECVEALEKNRDEVQRIQASFDEDRYG